MKKEIKKTKKFDITTFETLDSNGNTLLKGGFSSVYNEKSESGGTRKPDTIVVVNNQVAGCGCIIIDVNAACPPPPQPPLWV